MLHAVNANTGAEVFAYVPSFVFENLKELKEPAYSHKFFVDLTPTVKDVEVSGVDKKILVGGLGKGGKGYFALDVTNPAAVTDELALAGNVLWEYPSPAGDDDMGYSYSQAAITDSHAGWVTIFGNGYNSVNGGAKLFILNALTGAVIRVIDTQASADCNGLSTPAVIDMNYDGKVDYVFAGDLQGNLWKFDLTDESSANWDVAYYDGATPKPVFKAMSPEGSAQPITSKPALMWACGDHGYMATFGTGKWLGSFDEETTRTETIYGIWDYGDDEDDTEYLGQFDSDRTNTTNPLDNQPDGVTLLKQTVVPCSGPDCDGDFIVLNDQILRVLTDAMAELPEDEDPWETTSMLEGVCTVGGDNLEDCDLNGTPATGANPDLANLAGWYFDMPQSGERVVSNPLIREGRVIYVTFTPEQVSPCAAGGTSVLMQMDACSGGRTEDPLFDINDDGYINEDDLITIGTDEVSVTGKKKSGRLQTPAIVIMPNGETEVMILSSSGTPGDDGDDDDDDDDDGGDDLDQELTVSAEVGVSYWIELE
jgi:Tfp pilus tip-associated adhesin PilY1